MRIFCRKNHQQVKIVQQTRTMAEQIAEVKGDLAEAKLTPESDYTVYPNYYNGQISIKHGVDEKPKAIQRLKAKLARLEILYAKKNRQSKS